MGRNNLAGAWGEGVAAEYLRKKRFTILACNYRCRFGEIDIIAGNRKYLVFVEVKLRRSDRFAAAREVVGLEKQRRLRTTAMLWLQENPDGRQPRFDVIEIYAPEGVDTAHPEIYHWEDAFQ